MPENSIDLDFHVGWFMCCSFVSLLLTSSTWCILFFRTWIARTRWCPVDMSLAVAFITRFVAFLSCLHCRYDLIPCIIAFVARIKRISFENWAFFLLWFFLQMVWSTPRQRHGVTFNCAHTSTLNQKRVLIIFCFVHLMIVTVRPRWLTLSHTMLEFDFTLAIKIVIFLWLVGSRDTAQQFNSWKRQYFRRVLFSK